MKNLDELKHNWKQQGSIHTDVTLSGGDWQVMVRKMGNRERKVSMRYFWAGFTYHMIMFGFLANVIIVHFWSPRLSVPAAILFAAIVPFTAIMMKQFKKLAVLKIGDYKSVKHLPIVESIRMEFQLLNQFYRFKKKYEYVLVPLSAAVIAWLIVELYASGGVGAHPWITALLFIGIITSFHFAVQAENKKRFKEPLANLKEVLKDIEE